MKNISFFSFKNVFIDDFAEIVDYNTFSLAVENYLFVDIQNGFQKIISRWVFQHNLQKLFSFWFSIDIPWVMIPILLLFQMKG